MTDDEQLLKNRLCELSRRAYARGIWVYSEFLTLAEQDALHRLQRALDAPFELFGGLPDAERRVAAFGSEELCRCAPDAPLECLSIRPKAPKFAEPLTHRDFLGALMSLGMRREVLGDMAVTDGAASLVCLRTASAYILDNLTRVRHTDVLCARGEIPEQSAAPPEPEALVVASERLDALVGAVYRLSRGDARALVEAGVVFIDARACASPAHTPPAGSIISVRGRGRFLYEGVERTTKKDRLRVLVRRY